uniref:pyrroloquinoline quinone precursor peptide PqqA n=1 Tax=Massilia sp. METH4 TaxID=3123041 RepID=UPI00403F5F9F
MAHSARNLRFSPSARFSLIPGCPHALRPTCHHTHSRRPSMTWSKPAFIDSRFGFEITMYIANR